MTPQLRFPEFTDEWRVVYFDVHLNSIASGKSSTASDGDAYDIFGSTGSIGKSKDYDYEGDRILIARVGANAGSMYRVSGKYKVSDNTLIISLDSQTDTSFVQYSLQKFNLNRLVFGSGQPLVTGGQLKKTKLAFPSKPEQEKIAKFLTAVDERIAASKKKLELLKKYKKGVMQKIFSQQIRFMDENGNSYPEWEEKKFDEVLYGVATKQYQIQSSEYADVGNFPVVDQGQKSIIGYSNMGVKVFKDTPVIVFGDHTTILKFIDFDFIVGADGTKILKPKYDDNIKFLFYYLEQHQIIPEGYKRHFSTLKTLGILLPPKEEQQKIATFLTMLDDKIEAEQTRLTAAKQWKKGLLQRMFV